MVQQMVVYWSKTYKGTRSFTHRKRAASVSRGGVVLAWGVGVLLVKGEGAGPPSGPSRNADLRQHPELSSAVRPHSSACCACRPPSARPSPTTGAQPLTHWRPRTGSGQHPGTRLCWEVGWISGVRIRQVNSHRLEQSITAQGLNPFLNPRSCSGNKWFWLQLKTTKNKTFGAKNKIVNRGRSCPGGRAV